MSPALQRAIRSFVQAFVGSFLASNALSAVGTEGVVHWDIVQKAATAAFAAGLIALLSWLQNGAEDAKVIPALLKLAPAPVIHYVTKKAPAKKAAPRKRVAK
jgi:hypothetical protein